MYESPDFTIIEKKQDLELRLYQAFFTVAIHEPSLKGYGGFGYLFQYISGENRNQTKMKMTVPVINDLAKEEQSMEFVIPKMHHGNIPEPQYQAMKIKHYPVQHVLVKTFSGFLNQSTIAQFMEHLPTLLNTMKLTQTSAIKIARYNGPYTLPFLRRNEIWVPVDVIGNLGKDHTT